MILGSGRTTQEAYEISRPNFGIWQPVLPRFLGFALFSTPAGYPFDKPREDLGCHYRDLEARVEAFDIAAGLWAVHLTGTGPSYASPCDYS
jgi:hypothetical protein